MAPTAASVVLEYFPEAQPDDVDVILWEYTGYPAFWGGDPEATLRAQLTKLKDAMQAREVPLAGMTSRRKPIVDVELPE